VIRSHIQTRYVVRCDLCGNQNRTVADGHGTPEMAYESALAAGWVLGDEHYDLCPGCGSEPCS
jgi:uncharacterized protein YifN (PemK superfamily)